MSNIKKNQTTNDEIPKDLAGQLDKLIIEAEKVNKGINLSNKELNKAADDIEKNVDESVVKVEQIFSDLDSMEQEAGDELEKLMMEEAQGLAKEE